MAQASIIQSWLKGASTASVHSKCFFAAHEKYNPVMLVACSLIVALGSYYWIEQPSRRFLNAWVKRKFEKPSIVRMPSVNVTA